MTYLETIKWLEIFVGVTYKIVGDLWVELSLWEQLKTKMATLTNQHPFYLFIFSSMIHRCCHSHRLNLKLDITRDRKIRLDEPIDYRIWSDLKV